MKNLVTRRSFLSTAGAWTIAWPLVRDFDRAWQPPNAPLAPRPLVTFNEPGFPQVDAAPLREVPGAIAAASVVELIGALKPDAVLVWRHGSTFPAEGWPSILKFLEQGGGLLYAGGEPWTRPVTGAPGSRRLEPRTVAHLQALRLNQSYRLEAAAATVRRVNGPVSEGRPLPRRDVDRRARAALCRDPRLSIGIGNTRRARRTVASAGVRAPRRRESAPSVCGRGVRDRSPSRSVRRRPMGVLARVRGAAGR